MSEPQKTRLANGTEKFWFEWWRDSQKLNLALLRDLLGRQITLSTGLAAGSAAFLDASYAGPVFRGLAVVCFLAALVLACIGIFPRVERVRACLEEIQESKQRAFDRMQLFLMLSAIASGIGFGSIVLGWMLKMAALT